MCCIFAKVMLVAFPAILLPGVTMCVRGLIRCVVPVMRRKKANFERPGGLVVFMEKRFLT